MKVRAVHAIFYISVILTEVPLNSRYKEFRLTVPSANHNRIVQD